MVSIDNPHLPFYTVILDFPQNPEKSLNLGPASYMGYIYKLLKGKPMSKC